MNKVEKIKAEIERLKNALSDNKEKLNLGEIIAVNNCYNNLIFFINSLEEEPVSKDLEEACDEYYDKTWDEHGGKAMVVDGCHDIWFPSQATDDFFKAGAQWQKKQDQSTIELAEDHAYLAGQEKIIDMACEFLRSHIDKQLVIYHEHTWRSRDEFIEGFKKAMEE